MTQRGAVAPHSSAGERFDSASLDAAVIAVASNVDRWASTGPSSREALLARVVADTAAAAPAWNEAACAAKGLAPGSVEAGEELFSGIGTFVRMAQMLRQSLDEISQSGRPRIPGPVRHATGDRIVVGVMPRTTFDKVLFSGQRGEVWMQPNVTIEDVKEGQAACYTDPSGHRGVSLVLGAGNVGSLGPRDVLTKLFAEGKVVVLKANPVNDYLVEHWERAMKALIDEGVLRIVRGGAAAGAHLVAHSLVDDIHITGSDKTHDAVVFGTGEEGARRKAAGERLVTKPVSCELGNVSPVVIVPGNWSAKDISYQAAHVATMLANNAGFNCLTPRMLVTWKHWPQREAFLSELEATLSRIPTRRAYYPGARDRYAAFLGAHPDAVQLGDADDERLAWTILRDVDAASPDDIALNVEAFCSLMGETALDTPSPEQFVDAAVEFCNDVVWGTLSMTLIAHPRELKDPVVGPRVAAAVADLRYGSIGLNLWHAMSFAFSTTTWGAYPGHPVTDIQSGSGVVGNALLFDRPQKSVVTGPFRAFPPPAWFATAKGGSTTMERFFAFESSPSAARLPALLFSALRG